jgi:hypothetical protein
MSGNPVRRGILNLRLDAGIDRVIVALMTAFKLEATVKSMPGCVAFQISGDNLPIECEGKCLPVVVQFDVEQYGTQSIVKVKAIGLQSAVAIPDPPEETSKLSPAEQRRREKLAKRKADQAAKPAGKLGRLARPNGAAATAPSAPKKAGKAAAPAGVPAASNDS